MMGFYFPPIIRIAADTGHWYLPMPSVLSNVFIMVPLLSVSIKIVPTCLMNCVIYTRFHNLIKLSISRETRMSIAKTTRRRLMSVVLAGGVAAAITAPVAMADTGDLAAKKDVVLGLSLMAIQRLARGTISGLCSMCYQTR